MRKETGGPAFPAEHEGCDGIGLGMTLRDYFAGKAISGCLPGPNSMTYSTYADWAYKIADAMLAERAK